MTTKKPAVVRVDAVVRAIKKEAARLSGQDWPSWSVAKRRRLAFQLDGLACALDVVKRLARPAQRKGKR